jgi:hypothetical protein
MVETVKTPYYALSSNDIGNPLDEYVKKKELLDLIKSLVASGELKDVFKKAIKDAKSISDKDDTNSNYSVSEISTPPSIIKA